MPSQAPSLAATLQHAAASQATAIATSAHGGVGAAGNVRINPMMVTVDPSRHMQQQQAVSQQFVSSADASKG